MNAALPFEPPARRTTELVPADPNPRQVLAELLTLNEEMVVQLRLERLTVVGTAHFLSTMIEQHEKTAALLRQQLGAPPASPV